MAAWKKALAVALVIFVGMFPVLAQQFDVQLVTMPLLQGQELSDKELLRAEG